jgi:hypothetical protein
MINSSNSRWHQLLIVLATLWLFSCKKHPVKDAVDTPVVPVQHILLKDITIPNLPSPYYHFEYTADSLVKKVDFASGYTMYDVLYSGNKIGEMRNNIIINHDTLRYQYDNAGKPTLIKFINSANVNYRLVFFSYEGAQVKTIEWHRKVGDVGYIIDRSLSFTYYADGNVKTITEHRPPMTGVDEYTSVKTFEQYDDKINVDDFSLIHDGIHDHLFLLQGFRLQKNNPKKEKLSVNGTDLYTNDYTYTYNSNGTPSNKAGDFLYLSGQYAGQRFRTNSFYSYY